MREAGGRVDVDEVEGAGEGGDEDECGQVEVEEGGCSADRISS